MSSIEYNKGQAHAGEPRQRRKPVVVLAEDNDDARRIYSLILRHYGYEVEEVTTGSEAVEVTRSLLPSLHQHHSIDRVLRAHRFDVGLRGTTDVRRLHPEAGEPQGARTPCRRVPRDGRGQLDRVRQAREVEVADLERRHHHVAA